MTRIRVRPEALAGLAVALGNVAQDAEWGAGHARDQSWSLGPGGCAAALSEVLGDFEHQRLALGRVLDDLAGRVRAAGAAYAEVDDAILRDSSWGVDGGAG